MCSGCCSYVFKFPVAKICKKQFTPKLSRTKKIAEICGSDMVLQTVSTDALKKKCSDAPL